MGERFPLKQVDVYDVRSEIEALKTHIKEQDQKIQQLQGILTLVWVQLYMYLNMHNFRTKYNQYSISCLYQSMLNYTQHVFSDEIKNARGTKVLQVFFFDLENYIDWPNFNFNQ